MFIFKNIHFQNTRNTKHVKECDKIDWNTVTVVYSAESNLHVEVKVKTFPYSIPSVGPGADPGVQAVSPQVTVHHPPGGRLPLLSARPAVTSPAAEHHRPWPVSSYTA